MSPSRRTLLGGVAAVLSAAGCLSTPDGPATEKPTTAPTERTPTPTTTPASPIGIDLRNGLDERLTATVTVAEGSTVIAERSPELPPAGRVTVDAGISDPGEYRVAVDVDGGPTGAATFGIGEYDLANASTIIVGVRAEDLRFLITE
jgi:hypothetical protein